MIVDLMRRKLAVGGTVYISYNCTPGWSAGMPLRHLMNLHIEFAGSDDQGLMRKIDGALGFAKQIADAGALYFRSNPGVSERLQWLMQQNRAYLAHEYFNSDWDPLPFSEVAQKLSDAKLDFAVSADLLAHMAYINVGEEGRALLARIANPVLREFVRDYLFNQQFRKDVFIRGCRPMYALQRIERLRSERFVLLNAPERISFNASGPAGEISMNEGAFRPLIEIMAEGRCAPKSIAEIVAHRAWKRLPLDAAIEALIFLTASGQAAPVQPDSIIEQAKSRCKGLNTYICERSRYKEEIGFLASPLIGSGVPVERLDQLFILARQKGHTDTKAWASYAWDALDSQGQKLMMDGKVIESPDENKAKLRSWAMSFASERLPILQVLGIA